MSRSSRKEKNGFYLGEERKARNGMKEKKKLSLHSMTEIPEDCIVLDFPVLFINL